MSDALAREDIAVAREHNAEAQKALNGAGDDTSAAMQVVEELDELVGQLKDKLETVGKTLVVARDQADNGKAYVISAETHVDLTELENAAALLVHVNEQAEGMSAVVSEAEEQLGTIAEAVEELKTSLLRVNEAGDEAQVSTGSAEENLKQAQERLTS